MSESGENTGSGLQAFLSQRDVACPNCGYNLRGLRGDACPECSQSLVLQITHAEPAIGAWVTCVLSLAGVGGLFFLGWLVVLVICLKVGAPRGEEAWQLMVYPPVASAMTLPGCWFLVTRRGRRWFRKRSPAERRWAIGACLLLGAVLIAAWTASVLNQI